MVLKSFSDTYPVLDGTFSAHPIVIWHDLECGTYRADLPLWRELADARPDGAILDIGAGSGRVALDLARRGRRVIALDRDPTLLAALRQHAGNLDIQTVCADARSFALPHKESIALCIAPMQTVQLLGGSAGRMAFLRRAHAHMRPGGLLACALVSEIEPFDCTGGDLGPSPETCHIDGIRYTSQATRVVAKRQTILIERHRRTDGSCAVERDLIELDRIGAADLEREGIAAGLRPAAARHVPTTADHAGSDVVMLHV
jgi:SAM-dependent methyltransferase